MYVFGEWLVFIKLCIGCFFNIILCPVPVHSEYTYIPAMVTPNSKNAPPPFGQGFSQVAAGSILTWICWEMSRDIIN